MAVSEESPGLLAGYASAVAGAAAVYDEAVDERGELREHYRPVFAALSAIGPDLPGRMGGLDRLRRRGGVVFTARVDGELQEQPFPMDPVPRLLDTEQWRLISTGVEQRVRALNAFLQDAYGELQIVRDGLLPEWVVTRSPGYRRYAIGLEAAPRATVAGLDLLMDSSGEWLVLEDNLRVPSGLGYAIANRRTAREALPELYAAGPPQPAADVAALLRAALLELTPPRCPRPQPRLVLLSDGPANTAWFEHRLLAREMGVPAVQPGQLYAGPDGAVLVELGGTPLPVDVLYRRLDEDELPALRAGSGEPLGELLLAGVRAGALAIANAPGNGVGDDKATYAYVPQMIRYYLGERPVLGDVQTWVLADPEQYADVAGRLGDLVVKPVDGYGGAGVTFGSTLEPPELADLEATVAAAPHRFIAQRAVAFSTLPTLVDGRFDPRHVDLRVFTLTGERTTAVPNPLSRVALEQGSLLVNSSQGGGSKDTWLV